MKVQKLEAIKIIGQIFYLKCWLPRYSVIPDQSTRRQLIVVRFLVLAWFSHHNYLGIVGTIFEVVLVLDQSFIWLTMVFTLVRAVTRLIFNLQRLVVWPPTTVLIEISEDNIVESEGIIYTACQSDPTNVSFYVIQLKPRLSVSQTTVKIMLFCYPRGRFQLFFKNILMD